MGMYALMVPVLPGKSEQNREFVRALSGSRSAEFASSRDRFGLRSERVWDQRTPDGDVSIVVLESDDLPGVFAKMGASTDPFDAWWRRQIFEIHGMDLTQPPAGPMNELLIEWTR